MARKRESNSVITTIERLTGIRPYPPHLRNSLNNYLKFDNLFPGSEKIQGKVQIGHLEAPKTDALVLNVLSLDEAFRGEAALVAKIIKKEIPPSQLTKKIDAAELEIKRRLEAYTYWIQRMKALRLILADDNLDLKTVRLDQRLKAVADAEENEPLTYALRAITILEQSEERRRVIPPSAVEYIERADAYLALGNLAKAEANACSALDTDNAQPRAWFIRVVVALKLRNRAFSAMKHQEMVAQEIAEPLSSQEANARELVTDESDRVATQNQRLAEILPNALIYWPKLDSERYDHNDWREQVCSHFIQYAFANATSGMRRALSYRDLFRLNGKEPEWQLKFEATPFQALMESGDKTLPLEDDEIRALTILLNERDASIPSVFYSRDHATITNDLKLLHLRWILDVEGYARHWQQLSEQIAEFPPSWVEKNILRDNNLSTFWHMHLSINEGDDAVLASLDRWQIRAAAHDEEIRCDRLLNQYAVLFHRQFARKKYASCVEVSRVAAGYAHATDRNTGKGSTMAHPYNEAVSMPIGSSLYWKYMEIVSVLKSVEHTGLNTENEILLLLEAETWRGAFTDTSRCFWHESEEYEDGGGEDWLTAPYELDLRTASVWFPALQVATQHSPDEKTQQALLTIRERMLADDALNTKSWPYTPPKPVSISSARPKP